MCTNMFILHKYNINVAYMSTNSRSQEDRIYRELEAERAISNSYREQEASRQRLLESTRLRDQGGEFNRRRRLALSSSSPSGSPRSSNDINPSDLLGL